MIKGVLFDMDGGLSILKRLFCKAAILMFEELGVKKKVVPPK